MVKGVEAAGLPVVHMCTVTPISMTVGANRELVEKALVALQTEVEDQTIFE